MIRARDLHKTFGFVTALDGVSFVASGGSVTALLGPHGAGKTTTLRSRARNRLREALGEDTGGSR